MNDPPLVFRIADRDAGGRLDTFLKSALSAYSRERTRDLLRRGRVRVNGAVVRTGRRLVAGDVVEVAGVPPPETPLPLAAPDLPLAILYADASLLAIDKPAGMATHPLAPDETGTVANALVARFPELRGIGFGPLEPGLLHRLDTDTSGLLLVGRTPAAFAALANVFERGRAEKTYLALVQGHPSSQGRIDLAIGHDPRDRARMTIVTGGAGAARPASTFYTVVQRLPRHTLLEARIVTGARHQIRVHLAALGHPIAGDALYGTADPNRPRHFLHASRVVLPHPGTGAPLRLESPLPAELRRWIEEYS